MIVTFFDIDESQRKEFEKSLNNYQLSFFQGSISDTSIDQYNNTEVISCSVNSQIDAKIIASLPNLKLITVRSTGYDNINLKECNKREIVVSNVPDYGSHTVAEFTFTLILSLTRKIPDVISKTKIEKVFSFQNLKGVDLFGKTLGVIGTGKIGLNVIKIANGFGMDVLAYDLYKNEDAAWEMHFKYVGLEELLSNSDIITLHCPLTPETTHLLNSENISLIKRGSYLINTSRGQVIDQKVLRPALISGQLGGVALDVLENEKQYKNKVIDDPEILELIKLSNVIITPHTAFYTKEAETKIINTTIRNIEQFANNNPQNQVT